MAVSGSYDFNLTRNEIITHALRGLNVIAEGESATADQIADGNIRINVMIKAWRNRGIMLPLYQDIVVFLEDGESRYLIGPSGDKATALSDYVKTEIATAASSGASTITVDSATGIANGDVIGIEQDNGTIHWTTVNGAPAGAVITLTAVTTAAAAVDNHVYAYTSIAQRPIKVISARLRREDGTETDVEVVTRDQYNSISNKGAEGAINQVYYDPQLTNGVLYVWPTSDNVADVLILNAQRYIQDFDGGNDNLDLPPEWLDAVIKNLQKNMIVKYGVDAETAAQVRLDAEEALQDAEDGDQEQSIQFTPA